MKAMRDMLGRLPVFYKYLLSYVVVLLIPLAVIGFFFYQYFVSILKDEVTQSHQSMLEQIRDTVDVKFKEMNKIAVDISYKPELTPFQLEQNMHNAMTAQRMLNFTVANDFIQKMLLYIRGGDYLYSASSTYTKSLFINQNFSYRDWMEEQFDKDINEVKMPKLRPAEDVASTELITNRAITYIVPIPLNSPIPYGTALFLIDESTIKKLLNGVLQERPGNTLILNKSGQLVTALYDEPYLRTTEFAALTDEAAAKGSVTADLDHTSHIVSAVKSSATGWTYITLMPVSDFLKKVDEVKNRSLVAIALTLLIGGTAIYALMFVNYAPVRRLFTFAGNQWGRAVRSMNEVVAEIGLMAEQTRVLGSKLQTNRPAVREYLLQQLLKGKFTSVEQFRDKAHEIGLDFAKQRFFAVKWTLRRTDDFFGSAYNLLADSFAEHTAALFDCYRVNVWDENAVTFICATDEQYESQKEWLLNAHRAIGKKLNAEVTVGVGSTYADIGQIGKSYIEAAAALDYRLVVGRGKVIFFEETVVEKSLDDWYPKQELEYLGLYIKQGNTEQINRTVADLLQQIECSNASLYIVRCICYDVINALLKAAHDRSDGVGKRTITHPDVISLTKFDTLQEFAALVGNAADELCRALEASKQACGTGWNEQFRRYISEHFADDQLSLQTMADHYAVSVSHLKRLFKEHTGKSFSEYLNAYRMEQAKRLLVSSDAQIKEVVQQIGYCDVSSFIRKFKQEMNMTPGEYRKLHMVKRNGGAE